jgi:hypothetical protein
MRVATSCFLLGENSREMPRRTATRHPDVSVFGRRELLSNSYAGKVLLYEAFSSMTCRIILLAKDVLLNICGLT